MTEQQFDAEKWLRDFVSDNKRFLPPTAIEHIIRCADELTLGKKRIEELENMVQTMQGGEPTAPCSFCVHENVGATEAPCIDCEYVGGGFSMYRSKWNDPCWGDVLHALMRNGFYGSMRIVKEGMQLIDDLKEGLKSARERIAELEETIKHNDNCSFLGAMRDCPTHGESAQLKEIKAKLEAKKARTK